MSNFYFYTAQTKGERHLSMVAPPSHGFGRVQGKCNCSLRQFPWLTVRELAKKVKSRDSVSPLDTVSMPHPSWGPIIEAMEEAGAFYTRDASLSSESVLDRQGPREKELIND